ncbi:PAQR family membrane homeostasis protein TrhA [Inquilinus limosus]|uniref:Hemolysin III n=1 Tax=Inquilinus limosus TaxID=171674 RepID=A0A211ZL97_9PROT|nr:hemolysin III family protein [Inquilinus limosus]OWJ66020.1 hemolysin III [Inquilinus limosus]
MTEGIVAHTETLAEEIANAITHGVGAALAVAGLVVLLVLASLYGGALEIVSLAIYGSTLVLTYVASTLLHAARSARFKHVCNLLDHASIYLLIAGTYTPFLLLGLRGAWGWTLFAVIWGLAVTGVVLRLVLRHYGRHIALPLYLGMGWLILVAIGPVWSSLGGAAVGWILAGGLAYTAGVAFYVWERLPFNHMIWHLFVLAGSALHFTGIMATVVPRG